MGLTLGGGTLYFGDVNNPGKSISVKEVTIDECVEDSNSIVKPITNGESFTITMETKINRNIWLSLMLGRRVTNNWLKMHDGIMTRKYSRRKHSL